MQLNFVCLKSLLPTTHPQDCSVAKCRVFKCNRFMGRLESKQYKISANISSAWIEQVINVCLEYSQFHL